MGSHAVSRRSSLRRFAVLLCGAGLVALTGCGGSSSPTNPSGTSSLTSLSGTWSTPAWGGVGGNPLAVRIDQSTQTGTIQSIGTQTFGYAVGDVVWNGIATTATNNVFSCNAIFRYGTNNQSVATTTGTITLQGSQILVRLNAAAGVQPPEYTYSRQ